MKLVIVGRGPGWEKAKEETADQVWAVSTVFLLLSASSAPPDLIFQLHDKSLYESWLKDQGGSVVLMRPDADLPSAKVLPAAALIAKYGHKFASSFVWMMALAIEQGFDEISIHGVHLAHKTEYAVQRDSFFYFYGVAEARGVKITVPRDSGIFLGDHLYGVQNAQE